MSARPSRARAAARRPATRDDAIDPARGLALQRVIGNRATVSLLERRLHAELADHEARDPREREADRAAQLAAGRAPVGALGRLSAADPGSVGPRVRALAHQASGGGRALPEAPRAAMESAFAADFDGVRVHDDDRADRLNRALHADAFTFGRDVFFRSGAYRPGTSAGDALLAHELAHVVQQTGPTGAEAAGPRTIQRKIRLRHEGLILDAVVDIGAALGLETWTRAFAALCVLDRHVDATYDSAEILREALAAQEPFVSDGLDELGNEKVSESARRLREENDPNNNNNTIGASREIEKPDEGLDESANRMLSVTPKSSPISLDDVNEREWAVLHRMKDPTPYEDNGLPRPTMAGFTNFLKARYGASVDVTQKFSDYHGTHAKYHPSRWSDVDHTWDSNKRWLSHIITNFAKVLLTDIPLTYLNVWRQSVPDASKQQKAVPPRHNFSAYAREIAKLLDEGFVPLEPTVLGGGERPSLRVVGMVNQAKVPLDVAPAAVVDRAMAKRIHRNKRVSPSTAFSFFEKAGLPVVPGAPPPAWRNNPPPGTDEKSDERDSDDEAIEVNRKAARDGQARKAQEREAQTRRREEKANEASQKTRTKDETAFALVDALHPQRNAFPTVALFIDHVAKESGVGKQKIKDYMFRKRLVTDKACRAWVSDSERPPS